MRVVGVRWLRRDRTTRATAIPQPQKRGVGHFLCIRTSAALKALRAIVPGTLQRWFGFADHERPCIARAGGHSHQLRIQRGQSQSYLLRLRVNAA
jgi:hypothetical protein